MFKCVSVSRWMTCGPAGRFPIVPWLRNECNEAVAQLLLAKLTCSCWECSLVLWFGKYARVCTPSGGGCAGRGSRSGPVSYRPGDILNVVQGQE